MGERFGSSVVNIGDINKDGHLDVAIGAPGGPFGGSVYIFNGAPDGITSRSELISIASLEVLMIIFQLHTLHYMRYRVGEISFSFVKITRKAVYHKNIS